MLVYSGGNQTVGIRFNGVDLPQGATINNAYVKFQVDEVTEGASKAVVAFKSGGPPRNHIWDVRVTNASGATDVLAGAYTVTP
ncbi:MAG: hypothetical protein KDE51_09550 [Anaerolineales bacterium]|nr:hypothetical protein [Anaerolineales bacterium]